MANNSSNFKKVVEVIAIGFSVIAGIVAATWYVTDKINENKVIGAEQQKQAAVEKLKAYEDLEKQGGIPQLIKELKTAATEASATIKAKNAETLLEAARKDLSEAKSQIVTLETNLANARAEASKLAEVQNELNNSRAENSALSAEVAQLKTKLQAFEGTLKELEEFTLEEGSTRLIFGNQIVVGVRSIYSSSVSITFENNTVYSLDVGKYQEFSFGGAKYRLLVKKVVSNSTAKAAVTFGIFPDSVKVTVK